MNQNNSLIKIADKTHELSLEINEVRWNFGKESTIAARSDNEALTLWVNERGAKSKATKDNYIREGNKFLIWLREYKQVEICTLKRDDIIAYKEFLRSPPVEMIGAKKARDAEDWMPFFETTPLDTTVKYSFGVICALLAWLASTGYIKHNPAEKLPREKTSSKWRRRAISDDVLGYVMDYLEEMPRDTALQDRRYRRMRWVFHLLRLTGMRIGEIQSSSMGDVKYETRDGKRRCFLEIIGKGQKERWIPVIDELEKEMISYKQSIGIGVVKPKDIPLICAIESGRLNERVTRQAIHNAVKLMITKTSEKLMTEGLDSEAEMLQKVSAHWFRHTYATNLIDSGASLTTGRDNLGHASLATTSIYSHSNHDKRFDETELLKK